MVKNGAKNVKEKYGSNSAKTTFKSTKVSEEQIRQQQFEQAIKQNNQNARYHIDKEESSQGPLKPNVDSALDQSDEIAKICKIMNSENEADSNDLNFPNENEINSVPKKMLSGFGDNIGIHKNPPAEEHSKQPSKKIPNGNTTIAGAMKSDVYSMFSDINLGMSGAKKIISKVTTEKLGN